MCASFVKLIIIVLFLVGCRSVPTATPLPPTATRPAPTSPLVPTPTVTIAMPTSELPAFRFPQLIDPARQYLFYLHGKIAEDQGIHAVSEIYGEYEYEAILNELQASDFVVISERRPKNTDGQIYAHKIVKQINLLLEANVPPENITVVGASKGASIAVAVSYILESTKTNFVLLGSCYPDWVEELKQNQIFLYGNILAIYDSVDEYAGSCEELFKFSEGKGIARHDEIVLQVGTGHGILYKPLKEWIIPTAEWGRAGSKP